MVIEVPRWWEFPSLSCFTLALGSTGPRWDSITLLERVGGYRFRGPIVLPVRTYSLFISYFNLLIFTPSSSFSKSSLPF